MFRLNNRSESENVDSVDHSESVYNPLTQLTLSEVKFPSKKLLVFLPTVKSVRLNETQT